MARSDLIIKLVKAALTEDQSSVKQTAETMIAEARKKQQHTVADRLNNALQSANARPPHYFNKSLQRSTNEHTLGKSSKDFLAEIRPQKSLTDLILPDNCKELCQELIEEQHRADVLRAHGLEPRNRILLAGPPGNGKTTLAEAIAYELAVPFFIVRYETVIGSFLGETSSRLKQIFDYARTVPCVLFFDEFDTLGKERGDTHELGEIKRVVSALLLQIDDLPSYTTVVTATNHPELLDRAVWRRFQIKIELPKPTQHQLEEYYKRFFERYDEPGHKSATLAKYTYGVSFSEIEEFCLDIQRRYILAMGNETLKEITKKRLFYWKHKFQQNNS